MELEYWKERINDVKNRTDEIRRFKARLLDIAQLYDRFKDPEQKLCNNLRQLEPEIAAYDQQLHKWTPKYTAYFIGVTIIVYLDMYILYNAGNFILCGIFGIFYCSGAYGQVMLTEDYHSATKGLRDICASLIYMMDQENNDIKRDKSSK
ncbi:hypothetical protein BC940DRAFT_294369 [Gongronella butleri]|nr:hypothetical protein BC940DRAFT_294369 [Gongronella butleri]